MIGYLCLALLALWVGWWCLDESAGNEDGDRWLIATGAALLGCFACLPLWM